MDNGKFSSAAKARDLIGQEEESGRVPGRLTAINLQC